ncbi:O-antigen ligase family protein [Patulibacter defluvii]|uniref:O-antigen ligase family protein n=1 Tax=Patulibacter defluvii TaxID=3095358 RepID=UPI002A74BA01|nr:O-antigen ligase family protein [Patulibacter sp. DM4]
MRPATAGAAPDGPVRRRRRAPGGGRLRRRRERPQRPPEERLDRLVLRWGLFFAFFFGGYAGTTGQFLPNELLIAAPFGVLYVLLAIHWPAVAVGIFMLGLPYGPYVAQIGEFKVITPLVLAAVLIPILFFHGIGRQRLASRPIGPAIPFAFGTLLAWGILSTAFGGDVVATGARMLYLSVFGLLGAALLFAMRRRVVRVEDVGLTVVIGGALGACGVLFQFLLQFARGEGYTINWVNERLDLFAAASRVANLKSGDFDLVRGIFPFMAVPSAGQYLMVAILLGAAMLLLRMRVSRTVIVVCLGIMLAALIVTFSRQSWVGLAVALIAFAGLRTLPWLTFVALLGVGGLALLRKDDQSFLSYVLSAADTSTESTGERVSLMSRAAAQVPDHVFLGTGRFSDRFDELSGHITSAHNVYLQVALESGVFAAIALIVLLLTVIGTAFHRRLLPIAAPIVAVAVAALFDDTMYLPRNGMLVAIVMAIAVFCITVEDRRVFQQPAADAGTAPPEPRWTLPPDDEPPPRRERPATPWVPVER